MCQNREGRVSTGSDSDRPLEWQHPLARGTDTSIQKRCGRAGSEVSVPGAIATGSSSGSLNSTRVLASPRYRSGY